MNLRTTFTSIAVGITMLASPTAGLAQSAQDAATEIDSRVRAELAASTLSVENLPTGYVFAGETFLGASDIATGDLDPASLTDAGFVTQYVSVYINPDAGASIRSYVSSWTNASAAEAGFALIEDESLTSPGSALADGETAIGDEPREMTTGTYPGDDGRNVATVDITFRRDHMLAGVALESSDGTELDTAMVDQLASQLDERVQAVQSGESPQHTDLGLPDRALSFATEGTIGQAGFLGPVEVEAIYGAQGSVLEGVEASWVESTFLGGSFANSPSVTVGITTFGSPTDASSAVEQSADLFAPLSNQEPVGDVQIEGTDAFRAYRFSGAASEGESLDSYRIIFATDITVSVVDVQGVTSIDVAAESATDIATAQLACQGGASCEIPELPAELSGAS